MTGVVVQVRLDSTRLPGKALLPLGGATITDHALRRLALIPANWHILATDEPSAAELEQVAARNGFQLLAGPTEDVLARFCMAIRGFDLDLVLRATGDNPLVSHELATLLIDRRSRMIDRDRPQYSAYAGIPLGMGVELVSAEALLRAEAEARSAAAREHVCPYLYAHPELFTIERPEAPREYRMADARVTIDTASDYEKVLEIFRDLFVEEPIPSLAVLEWLRARRSAPPGAVDPGGPP